MIAERKLLALHFLTSCIRQSSMNCVFLCLKVNFMRPHELMFLVSTSKLFQFRIEKKNPNPIQSGIIFCQTDQSESLQDIIGFLSLNQSLSYQKSCWISEAAKYRCSSKSHWTIVSPKLAIVDNYSHFCFYFDLSHCLPS